MTGPEHLVIRTKNSLLDELFNIAWAVRNRVGPQSLNQDRGYRTGPIPLGVIKGFE